RGVPRHMQLQLVQGEGGAGSNEVHVACPSPAVHMDDVARSAGHTKATSPSLLHLHLQNRSTADVEIQYTYHNMIS
ncbi:unnamed protein product, partial [Closterium sp. NIES-65]